MKRGKVVRYEGIKLQNSEVMKEVEKLDKIKENETKEKTKEI